MAVNEDYPKGLEYYKKALEIGEEINDILTLVLANNAMGCCLSYNGEFEKALPYLKKALAINVKTNVQWGIVIIKLNIIYFVYRPLGNVKLAYQTSQEAIRIANESGDILSKAQANYALGVSYYLKGFLEEAEEHLLKSSDLLQKSNQLAYAAGASIFLSGIYLDMEEYETSQKFSEEAISFWQRSSMRSSHIIGSKIFIALAKVMNNEEDIKLNEIFNWYENIKNKWARGRTCNHISKILINLDNHHLSEAEVWIKRSIETNHKYGMLWNLARGYALYAELFKRKGDLPKAKENLSKAIKIFREGGSDGWTEKYEKELEALS
jgi:tetratricopeptide (TPR) repeat protein